MVRIFSEKNHQSVGVENPIGCPGLNKESIFELVLEDEPLEEGVLPVLAVVVARPVPWLRFDHRCVVPLQFLS